MNKKLIKIAFLNAIGTTIYIAAVAWLMSNANAVFGEKPGIIGPIAFLLLFVVSASITGSLVLGRPIYIYLEGQKREAVKLLIYTIACLTVFIIAIFFYFFIF